MANSIYVVDNLVNSLLLRGLPPQSQNTFTQAGFVQVLSEEMLSNIVPLIDSVSEEYFVTYSDQAYLPAVTTWAIPYRAVGNKLRDVVWVDSSGLEIPIPRLRPEDIKLNVLGVRNQPSPFGYFLKDDSVQLFLGSNVPTAPTYPTIRFKYIRRPNILTLSTNCGQITAINGNQVTVSFAPTTWTTSSTFDIIKGTPNFVSRGDDLTISSIVGTVITFSALPSGVAIGDWVCDANYSPIPQIPVEGHLLLAQYGACKVLEAMGDTQGLAVAAQKAEKMKEQFLMIITPRVEGGPIRLVSRNGIGDYMDNGW